jgi:16S rRNA (cytosine967-C5)-methyltransferase
VVAGFLNYKFEITKLQMVSSARLCAFEILLRVDTQEAYASELLHSRRTDALSATDMRFCTEIVMGVLRWRSLLDTHIAALSFTPFHKLDQEVLTALRLGAYQIEFLARVPTSAAVNESVELVKQARKSSAASLVNAVLRKLAKARPHPRAAFSRSVEGATVLAREFAHPQWLVERWIANHGETTAARICAFDQSVPANAVRITDTRATAELADGNIKLAPGALMTSARRVISGEPTRTPAHDEGRIFIQDEGSQLIAALVGRGNRILDCCAAPGGKTGAIAQRNPQAEIIATDLHEHRARLMRRLVRAPNVRVIAADACALPVAGAFDRVLVDVPCSGTGTLARNPEIKWRLKPEDLSDLHARQVSLLHSAHRHLAPGGRLIYATCSLEPEEGEAVVQEVLERTGDRTEDTAVKTHVRLINCQDELLRLQREGELAWPDVDSLCKGPFLRTFPGVHPCDGFFAAVLKTD